MLFMLDQFDKSHSHISHMQRYRHILYTKLVESYLMIS